MPREAARALTTAAPTAFGAAGSARGKVALAGADPTGELNLALHADIAGRGGRPHRGPACALGGAQSPGQLFRTHLMEAAACDSSSSSDSTP